MLRIVTISDRQLNALLNCSRMLYLAQIADCLSNTIVLVGSRNDRLPDQTFANQICKSRFCPSDMAVNLRYKLLQIFIEFHKKDLL